MTVLAPESEIPSDSGPDKKLEAACKAWSLDKKQIARFFSLSKEYSQSPRRAFNWLPCSIKGTLVADNETWNFDINAASTATWTRQEEHRYWGCSNQKCEALVLMMPDGTQP
ncbi:MAG: hypothetical protein EOP91_09445 [Lysobacteraceae bacterium]|nr:MAG: hypothetical protein EOP91_09445 [Xanthomonadaceae bacterium]